MGLVLCSIKIENGFKHIGYDSGELGDGSKMSAKAVSVVLSCFYCCRQLWCVKYFTYVFLTT